MTDFFDVDGYELSDTVELMLSNDYKERFKAEYYQLVKRKRQLGILLRKYRSDEVDFKPSCSYALLESQYEAMVMYHTALKIRAKAENIEL